MAGKISLLAVALLILFSVPVAAPPLPGAPDCRMFPADNVWNKDISRLPVHPASAAWIRSIGFDSDLHPDFGRNRSWGIPYNVVGSQTPKVEVQFAYADESDAGPYPIPANPRVEGGGDRHILIVDRDNCRLYELYDVARTEGGWTAGSGAIWNLWSNALRPNGWTSADAAGLPILPGLVRFDEVARGVINHALRFTAPHTRKAHIYPARHHASYSMDPALPPMGARVRLKGSFDVSSFSRRNRVVLNALKKYGMILADNGGAWFLSGVSDIRWNDPDLNKLKRIHGSAFEVVNTRQLRNGN